jgi:hypothetical protein
MKITTAKKKNQFHENKTFVTALPTGTFSLDSQSQSFAREILTDCANSKENKIKNQTAVDVLIAARG